MKVAWFFAALAFIFSVAIQVGFSTRHGCGNQTLLLNVGENSFLLNRIRDDFDPPFCSADEFGHDGQFTYLIARDPFLQDSRFIALFNQQNHSLSYRYRRVLSSWLSGGFGYFTPIGTLYGLIIVSALSVACSAFAVAYWITTEKKSALLLGTVFFNPGIIISLVTLTSDHVAFGMAVLGLFFGARQRYFWSTLFFAAATLTKEVYVLPAFSFLLVDAVNNKSWRSGSIRFALVVAPLACWLVFLKLRLLYEPIFAVGNNITWPFLGIFDSAPYWLTHQRLQDKIFTAVALGAVAMLSFKTICRPSFSATAFNLPWILLLVCSGSVVWDVGNNIVRASCMVFLLLGGRLWAPHPK